MDKEIYIIWIILAVSVISISLFSNEVFAQQTPEDCGPNKVFREGQCFALAATFSVKIPAGTSVPGCEETSEGCFIPPVVTIDLGRTIHWTNDDNAVHTVTSGNAAEGPDGNFDSSMILSGETFSHHFIRVGEHPYFCMLHPWQVGTVIVVGSPSGDGKITFDIVPPKILQPKDIIIDASDSKGAFVTYEVLAIDNEDEIVKPSCIPRSGSLFSIGDTKVVCSAFDSAGNAASKKTFLVTVNPPSLSIPDWIKEVAAFWCDDKIDDASFIEGIQYLIDNGIIIISGSTSIGSGGPEIPSWIKNNACWWSQGLISDSDFASGLEFLIVQGIIRVN